MKRTAIALALALCAAAVGAHEPRIPAQILPTCVDNFPTAVWLVNSSDASTCDPTSTGTTEAHCCCANGTWAACAGSGSGSGDIESVFDCTSGACTDLAPGSGHSLDGGGADAMSPATRSTSLPGTCTEGQQHHDTDSGGSETYVCTATDTWTKLDAGTCVFLDTDDDGSNESICLTEIASNRDRFSVLTEPSADKARFDFSRLEDRYLSGPPSSPATPDDEFNGSLGGSWTVVSGGSGTVDAHSNASAVEVYDLSTRSGFLLIQVGNDTGDDVLLRQDYTLPDGSLVVGMFFPPLTSGGNAAQCGIALNDNDTSPTSGNTMEIIFDAQAAGSRVLVQSTGATSGGGIADDSTGVAALAITRVDAGANKAYAGWASFNGGTTWVHVDTAVHSSTLDNLWLFCDTRSTHAAGQNDPVFGIDWLRGAATTNLYTLAF